jgi:hypothetical protein
MKPKHLKSQPTSLNIKEVISPTTNSSWRNSSYEHIKADAIQHNLTLKDMLMKYQELWIGNHQRI